MLRESDEFIRGAAGEKRVAAWFQDRGWFVIPSYDYAGSNGDKAPRLQGLSDAYAVPDLDIAKSGCRRWVEVKTKKEAVLWRKTQELRHGIEIRLLDQYQRVQKITGTDCWLAIYEESTGELMAQELNLLGTPYGGTDRGRPMAYWPRAWFRHLHTFAPET